MMLTREEKFELVKVFLQAKIYEGVVPENKMIEFMGIQEKDVNKILSMDAESILKINFGCISKVVKLFLKELDDVLE